jgi:hypothetical protein
LFIQLQGFAVFKQQASGVGFNVQSHGHCGLILPQLGRLPDQFGYSQGVVGVLAFPLAGFRLKLLYQGGVNLGRVLVEPFALGAGSRKL